MDQQRWQQIDDLFSAAISCVPGEREQLLDARCRGDTLLRNEVASLVEAHERSSHIIDSRAFEVVAQRKARIEPQHLTGQTIGSYRICGFLGAGGTGAVYEAEQSSPRRRVALKLMRALPYRDELTARLFRREGEALARLQHIGIATIYEAGCSHDGWHYFAMERVDGRPLTRYVRETSLETRQRLDLFARICDAVHYAHQRGVIHRDLKPSNILVQKDGQPKILDFGLARVTDADGERSMTTEPGSFHGTLAYASPEQTRGDPADIDARSDVYSLGVILYELLADRMPYDTRRVPFAEAAHVICDRQPQPLGSIRPDLRGDPETIALKALEKAPDRRYSSAAALADDVRRYLRDEPIEARRDSGLYVLKKTLRRYRRAVTVVTAFMVLTLVALFGLSRLATREADQRRVATREATRAQHALKFIGDMFAAARDPRQSGRAGLKDVLREAAARVPTEFASDPVTAVEIDLTIGRVYAGLQYNAEAAILFDRALTRQRALYGPDDERCVSTLALLAAAYKETFDPRALPVCRELVEQQTRHYGPDHVLVADAFGLLARALEHHGANSAEVIAVAREAVVRYEKQGGPEAVPPALARDLGSMLLIRTTDWSDARRYLRMSMARADDSAERIWSATPLCRAAWAEQDYAAADELARLLIDESEQRHPGDTQAQAFAEMLRSECDTAFGFFQSSEAHARQSFRILNELGAANRTDALEALCDVLRTDGRYEEAHSVLLQIVALHGEHDPATFIPPIRSVVPCRVAQVLADQGFYQDALREAETGMRELLACRPLSPVFAWTLNRAAEALIRSGRTTEAQACLDEVSASQLKAFGHVTPATLSLQAELFLESHAFRPAAENAAAALDSYRNSLGECHYLLARPLITLSRAQMELNRLEPAERAARQAVDICTATLREGHPQAAEAMVALSEVCIRDARPEVAEPFLSEALRIQRQVMRAEHPLTGNTLRVLGRCAAAQGRRDEAMAYFSECHAVFAAAFGQSDPRTLELEDAIRDLRRTRAGRSLTGRSGSRGEALNH